jgi:hypothetical protein
MSTLIFGSNTNMLYLHNCIIPGVARVLLYWVKYEHVIPAQLYYTGRCTSALILGKISKHGARSGAVGLGTAPQSGRSRIRFTVVSVEFFFVIILSAALWPWSRLTP